MPIDVNCSAWKGFRTGEWRHLVNVRNFIQKNYTPYAGDESFLAPTSERTQKVWDKSHALILEELRKGILDVETDAISGINNFAPGYIDRDNEVIIGLQTDAPLKRIVNLYGGMRMAESALEQYGNLTRKTHANTSWDRARFESCGQKWMDLSEGHYGVSMLNDCKYGHSVRDSVIGLTLIKSGIEPNPTTDQEVHHFTYAIYPHAEKWQAAGTVPQAFFLNQPALAVQGGKPGESFSLAGLDAPNVVLETIKRAEDGDGAIVRMYECENSLTNVTLDWNLPFHAAESCNCLEQPDGEPVEVKDGKITFTVKPYEIKTIRIR